MESVEDIVCLWIKHIKPGQPIIAQINDLSKKKGFTQREWDQLVAETAQWLDACGCYDRQATPVVQLRFNWD